MYLEASEMCVEGVTTTLLETIKISGDQIEVFKIMH